MASTGSDKGASAAPSGPIDVVCMATKGPECDFRPTKFTRRALLPTDVLIDMKYCGVCHTDLHTAAGHLAALGMKAYPCVPGHELVGVCTAVGSKVTRVKVGDHVGVGCMVDSCMNCAACKRGEEQMCTKQVGTYGGKDNGSGRAATGPGAPRHTLGGYTTRMVVDEKFSIIIPKSYPLENAGPVMCAGVTLYDPLRRYGAKAGTRVGIVGIGGLGHVGIKVAKAMGCHVTAVTRSAAKGAFAKKCGADAVVISTNPAEMRAAAGSIDLLLNTIPSEHDFYAYMPLLAPKAKQVMLGLNTGLIAGFAVDAIVCGGSRIKGSGIGGIEATQAVIDLCAAHNILPEIKVVPVEEINAVYALLDGSNESGERYVLDLSTLDDGAAKRCEGKAPPKLTPDPQIPTGGRIVSAICGMLCCCRYC
jgi:uncharacterized zinc-type alcohol dehydrogenase-like protein